MFLPNKPILRKQTHFRGRGEMAGWALSAARTIIVADRHGVGTPFGRFDPFYGLTASKLGVSPDRSAPRVRTGIWLLQARIRAGVFR